MTDIDRFDPFERRISTAIDEIAAARAPEYLADVFRQTARTAQRRRWFIVERWLPVNRVSYGAAAVAIVIAIAGGAIVVSQYRSPSVGGPSPSPSPTSATATFISPLYRYSVVSRVTWSVEPATEPWPGGDGIGSTDSPYADVFRSEGSPDSAVAGVKALAVPDGTTAAGWLAQWERSREVVGQCFGSASPWTDVTVAGLPARRFEWRCDTSPQRDAKGNYDEYTFLAAGMGYVITGTPSMVDALVQSFRVP